VLDGLEISSNPKELDLNRRETAQALFTVFDKPNQLSRQADVSLFAEDVNPPIR